jgi:hypothetical protein
MILITATIDEIGGNIKNKAPFVVLDLNIRFVELKIRVYTLLSEI